MSPKLKYFKMSGFCLKQLGVIDYLLSYCNFFKKYSRGPRDHKLIDVILEEIESLQAL